MEARERYGKALLAIQCWVCSIVKTGPDKKALQSTEICIDIPVRFEEKKLDGTKENSLTPEPSRTINDCENYDFNIS